MNCNVLIRFGRPRRTTADSKTRIDWIQTWNLPASTYGPLDVSSSIIFLQLLTFVVQLHAFAKCNFAFGHTTFVEVHFHGHQGQSLFFRLADPLQHFASVHKQLSRPLWLMVPNRRLRILGDVAANQPQSLSLNSPISLIQLTLAIAQTLDFAAAKYQSTLQRVENFVAVSSLAIVANDLANRPRRLRLPRLALRFLRSFTTTTFRLWLSRFGFSRLGRFFTQGRGPIQLTCFDIVYQAMDTATATLGSKETAAK